MEGSRLDSKHFKERKMAGAKAKRYIPDGPGNSQPASLEDWNRDVSCNVVDWAQVQVLPRFM